MKNMIITDAVRTFGQIPPPHFEKTPVLLFNTVWKDIICSLMLPSLFYFKSPFLFLFFCLINGLDFCFQNLFKIKLILLGSFNMQQFFVSACNVLGTGLVAWDVTMRRANKTLMFTEVTFK